MKMQSQALLFGIESSKGEFQGTAYDSTKFHLSVDMGTKSNGKTIGVVTRPFKCGTSEEFKKWAHLKNNWPATGIPVLCEFDVVAGADQTSKLTLLAIKPATQAKAA